MNKSKELIEKELIEKELIDEETKQKWKSLFDNFEVYDELNQRRAETVEKVYASYMFHVVGGGAETPENVLRCKEAILERGMKLVTQMRKALNTLQIKNSKLRREVNYLRGRV